MNGQSQIVDEVYNSEDSKYWPGRIVLFADGSCLLVVYQIDRDQYVFGKYPGYEVIDGIPRPTGTAFYIHRQNPGKELALNAEQVFG